MLVAGKDQIAVDLVGADDDVVTQADFGHAFQLVAAENAAHRVVGTAQKKDAGPIGDGCLKGIKVYLVGSVGLPR